MVTLVIGGARSGKSRFAQSLAAASRQVAFVATAGCDDAEMAARITRHRQERPQHWLTIEAPLRIAVEVASIAERCEFVLVDCLTIWLSNVSWEYRESRAQQLRHIVSQEIASLVTAAAHTHVVVVTNELGCGLVPETAVGRSFRDLHGWMNQELAQLADRVYYLVAGIAMPIKQPAGDT